MKATSVASVGIVPEVLTSYNYERWSVFMTNYLMGKGLWDFVRGDSSLVENYEAGKHLSNKKGKVLEATPDIEQVEREVSWKKKNAKALHIIQISCGKRIQDELFHFETARHAWIHLTTYRNFSNDEIHYLPDVLSQYHNLDDHGKRLFSSVESGNYIEDIIKDSDVYMTSASGRTLLHIAVMAGNVKNVEKLVMLGREGLAYQQDIHGYTAIALVARYTGDTEIAKCIIETRMGSLDRQLEIPNKDNVIPILLAAANGHKELTSYLYSKTPSKVFEGTDSKNRVLLLSLCISAEIFDVALRLLRRYEDLAKESLSKYEFHVPKLLRESLSLPPTQISDPTDYLHQPLRDKFSSLIALAKKPSAFPSGTRSGFRERIIYEVLSVENEFADNCGYAKFLRSATRCGYYTSLHESSSGKCWSVSCFCRLVLNSLLLPLRLLGRLLHVFAYLLVQIFKYLDIFGTRTIYRTKYAHYEVLEILAYFCNAIEHFNDLQLIQALAYQAMLHAAQNGIIEFLSAMTKTNPDLLSSVDSCYRGIFSYSILYRKQSVFQLMICHYGQKKIPARIDKFGNNILHLAARLGPSSDCDSGFGAALQMQREIQWFKAVEKIVHPTWKENKNEDGKKPYEVFTENHEELFKAGEKWTKETATSYKGVANIIITIMFAAVFTIPGGNNQDTGSPIFLHDNIFNIFLLADALSIIASASSLLVFIGIHTSRYTAIDFLKALPIKLMAGLMLLLFSFCSMMIAFYAALNMILKGSTGSKCFVLVPIVSLGSVPITILIASQLRFIYRIFRSTTKIPISSF